MKRLIPVVLAAAFMATPLFAAGLKISGLMADPAFSALDPVQRLESLNGQLSDKRLSSSDLSGDLTARLFMDAIVGEADPGKRLDRYAQLRAANPKLPQTYELEQHLATQVLAGDPATKGGDELAKLRSLLRMENEKKISWPAAAPLYTGMLSAHLSGNAEYQQMSAADKIKYIRRITAEGVVKEMTATNFIRGVGWEMLSAMPVAQQAAALKAMEPGLDFFSKSSLGRGYAE